MRWGVGHVELAVLGYDDSIAFHDALFGYLNPRSYIGIEPEPEAS
jgi:hypothetical protein